MAKYGSKASMFQAIVRGAEPIRHPGSGVEIGRQKALVAEFGTSTPEIKVTGDDGEELIDPGTGRPIGRIADVRGHYFDSVVQGREKGWTDEERQMVEQRLDYLCVTQPSQVWHLEDAKLPEPLPGWANLSAARKMALASELGVLAEAAAFERQNDGDPDLIGKLEKKLAEQQAADSVEDALSAA